MKTLEYAIISNSHSPCFLFCTWSYFSINGTDLSEGVHGSSIRRRMRRKWLLSATVLSRVRHINLRSELFSPSETDSCNSDMIMRRKMMACEEPQDPFRSSWGNKDPPSGARPTCQQCSTQSQCHNHSEVSDEQNCITGHAQIAIYGPTHPLPVSNSAHIAIYRPTMHLSSIVLT